MCLKSIHLIGEPQYACCGEQRAKDSFTRRERMRLPLYDPDLMPSTIDLDAPHVLLGEFSQWHKHATKVNRFMS